MLVRVPGAHGAAVGAGDVGGRGRRGGGVRVREREDEVRVRVVEPGESRWAEMRVAGLVVGGRRGGERFVTCLMMKVSQGRGQWMVDGFGAEEGFATQTYEIEVGARPSRRFDRSQARSAAKCYQPGSSVSPCSTRQSFRR